MGLETVVHIDDLVSTNPISASDIVREGAAHLRNIKTALQNSFAGSGGVILVAAADASVTANTITLTPVPAIAEYTTRMLVVWHQAVANTGAVTMNISGLGAKAVVSVANAALVAGDLVVGRAYVGEYDGTSVQLVAVTKNYIDQLAFSAALPAQPGTAYYSTLRSITGTAAWGAQSICDIRSITTTDTVGAADIGNLIDCTSGTFTLTFAAAATLGDRSTGYIRNSGTGVVTIDGNGAETIDGIANYPMYPQEVRMWIVEGSTIKTIVMRSFYFKTVSTITYVHPPGYQEIEADLVAAGGGGGAGRRGAAGTVRSGGAPGGAPGRVVRKLRGLTAGSSYTVTVGAAGSGAAAQSADNTDGADGVAGGNTSFAALAIAYGGCAGKGGSALRTTSSGSGSLAAGTSSNAGAGLQGGLPSNGLQRGGTTTGYQSNLGEGGGGVIGTLGTAGGSTEWGGAASGALDVTATTVTAIINGSSIYGVGAGSAGGWITAADTLPATASNAGTTGTFTGGGGATGGTCGAAPTVGANGTAAATDDLVGTSGAGGGSTITAVTAAKAGGNGAAPGGAGGGGGAVLNGSLSGAGGNGADGRAIIKGVI